MSNTRRAKKPDPLAIMRSSKRPEASETVCVRGDLVAEFEALGKQLQAIRDKPTDRLVGNPEARRVAERMEALRQEMLDHTVELRFRAMEKQAFRDLKLQHPARKDNQTDLLAGVNLDTIPDPLIRACLVSPVIPEDDQETWPAFVDGIHFGEWDRLFTTCWYLNQNPVSVPFSETASLVNQSSGSK